VLENAGVHVYGANADQVAMAPARVVASAVIDVPRAMLLVGRQVQQGDFSPRVETFGLGSGVIRFALNPLFADSIPPAVMARIREASDSIAEAGRALEPVP
jgi:simple sugar transport system substrate-binding protein/basic membrane protein A